MHSPDDADIQEIQRALRDITHVEDGMLSKALKGMLERQMRVMKRLAVAEAAIERLEAADGESQRT